MPTPFVTNHYMNRFINSKKLVETKYTNKPQNLNMKQFEKRYQLPEQSGIQIEGQVRKMEKKDITAVLKLYKEQQEKYKMYYKFSQDDVVHFMMPKDNVVWTYVIEDESKKVTDFFSMHRLSQTCINSEAMALGHTIMHSGCLFYYGLSKNNIKEVTKQCLWLCKEEMECDAFSVMTVMDNDPVMLQTELGFLPGDGSLHWYFVNRSLGKKTLAENEVGTILI